MELQTQDILELLYDQDCVIIPTVGAFVAQRIGARLDDRQMRMLPPTKELIFNSQVRHNDGLLASFISKKYNVSMAEAMRAVDDYARGVNKQLKQGAQVMIAGVGSLSMVGENVSFAPSATAVLLKSSYGFAPVALVEHKDLVIVAHRHQRLKKFVGTAAALAVLLLIPSQVTDNEADKNIISASVASAFIASPVEEPATIDEVEEEKIETPYHIIVASFARESQADDYIRKQEMRGVNGLVKIASKHQVRVSVASFATRAEAAKANRDIRKLPGYETAWILYN